MCYLFLGIGNGLGNSVHIGLAPRRDLSSGKSVLSDFFNEVSLLELHKTVSNTSSSSSGVMLSGTTVSPLTTKIVSQLRDSSAWSEVQFSHDSSSSNIQPIRITWGKFLERSSLRKNSPV